MMKAMTSIEDRSLKGPFDQRIASAISHSGISSRIVLLHRDVSKGLSLFGRTKALAVFSRLVYLSIAIVVLSCCKSLVFAVCTRQTFYQVSEELTVYFSSFTALSYSSSHLTRFWEGQSSASSCARSKLSYQHHDSGKRSHTNKPSGRLQSSAPSKELLHWAGFCSSEHAIAQPCRITTSYAFQAVEALCRICRMVHLEFCKCARLRFHCANGLAVLRGCAPHREHWCRQGRVQPEILGGGRFQ